jgi:hypothetical protein
MYVCNELEQKIAMFEPQASFAIFVVKMSIQTTIS